MCSVVHGGTDEEKEDDGAKARMSRVKDIVDEMRGTEREGQTDRQTHTYIHTYLHTDRQTDIHTYTHTYIIYEILYNTYILHIYINIYGFKLF